MLRVSLVVILLAPTTTTAQARDVTVRITDRVSGLPLSNAEVIDRSNGRTHMTRDSGTVSLPWRGADTVRIRVRQVGYHFVDTVVSPPQTGGSMVIALSRVAYALPALPIT